MYILHKLYDSLCRQTDKRFEWLIIDDCSADDTKALVTGWIDEGKVCISYYRLPVNGGKHRAVNYGVPLANGELTFIVDSDDHLVENAIAVILKYWQSVRKDPCCAGIGGQRIYSDHSLIGTTFEGEMLDANFLQFRYKHKIKGDKAEAYRTSVLREFPFPEFEGETFLTEAVALYRMAKKYYLRWTNAPLYVCEYLKDGLTKNISTHLEKSPKGYRLYYKELMFYKEVDFFTRVNAIAHYCIRSIFGEKGVVFIRENLKSKLPKRLFLS
jgi:glycosyltransferase involved in cell wall biosynthesis